MLPARHPSRLRGITFIQEPSDQFFYRTSSFIQTLLLVPDFHRISRRNFAQFPSLQAYLLFRRTAVFYLRVADCQLLLSPPVGNLTLPRRNFLFTGGIILHLRIRFNLFFCQIIFCYSSLVHSVGRFHARMKICLHECRSGAPFHEQK